MADGKPGAPMGNNNAGKGKPWRHVLDRAIAQDDGKRLRKAAEALLDNAAAGEPWAVKEIADRLDGKAHQSVELSSDPENPLQITHGLDKDAIELLTSVR